MPKTLQDYFRDAWRRAADLPPEPEPRLLPDLPVLERTEWSAKFEQLMRNRMILGAFRYGRLDPFLPLRPSAPSAAKPGYDRVSSMTRRLERYAATGNTELLVDVANLALLEFVEGAHPHKHFHSHDDGEHVQSLHP